MGGVDMDYREKDTKEATFLGRNDKEVREKGMR